MLGLTRRCDTSIYDVGCRQRDRSSEVLGDLGKLLRLVGRRSSAIVSLKDKDLRLRRADRDLPATLAITGLLAFWITRLYRV